MRPPCGRGPLGYAPCLTVADAALHWAWHPCLADSSAPPQAQPSAKGTHRREARAHTAGQGVQRHAAAGARQCAVRPSSTQRRRRRLTCPTKHGDSRRPLCVSATRGCVPPGITQTPRDPTCSKPRTAPSSRPTCRRRSRVAEGGVAQMPRVHAVEELMPNRAEACPTSPSLSEACRRRGPPLRERPQPPPAGAWLARLLFARPTVVPPHAAVAAEGGIRPLRAACPLATPCLHTCWRQH